MDTMAKKNFILKEAANGRREREIKKEREREIDREREREGERNRE